MKDDAMLSWSNLAVDSIGATAVVRGYEDEETLASCVVGSFRAAKEQYNQTRTIRPLLLAFYGEANQLARACYSGPSSILVLLGWVCRVAELLRSQDLLPDLILMNFVGDSPYDPPRPSILHLIARPGVSKIAVNPFTLDESGKISLDDKIQIAEDRGVLAAALQQVWETHGTVQ